MTTKKRKQIKINKLLKILKILQILNRKMKNSWDGELMSYEHIYTKLNEVLDLFFNVGSVGKGSWIFSNIYNYIYDLKKKIKSINDKNCDIRIKDKNELDDYISDISEIISYLVPFITRFTWGDELWCDAKFKKEEDYEL